MDLLSRIKYMSWQKALEVIESDIAVEDKCWAIKRIQNRDILINLLDYTDNLLILKTIIGESILSIEYDLPIDLAFGHDSWKVRLAAIDVLLSSSRFDEDCREIFDSSEYEKYSNRSDLDEIALNDENWHNRIVAALLIDDESVLESVAMNDLEYYVRIAAVCGIENQDLLVNVIKKNYVSILLKLAGLKVTDEDKIIELIKTKDDFDVVETVSGRLDEEQLMGMFSSLRIRAKRGVIRNIRNQLFLIDTVYGTDDGALSLYACQNILNQKVLHDIVIDERLQRNIETFDRFISFPDDYIDYSEFLYYATSFIIDDNLLADIVFNHCELKHEFSIAFHILNPSILADIFLRFPLDFTDIHCKVHITDAEKLFEIAMNHPIQNTRIAAAKMIFDKGLLEKIIESGPPEEVRKCAIENLNIDESEFSLETDNLLILIEVIKSIDDDSKLLEIFNGHGNYNVKQAVCENITDEQLLKDIAVKNELRVASQAINNISTESILAEIALNASFENVCVYAICHIDGNDALEDVFENSSSYGCKINALSRITDEKFLAEVASGSPDEYLKTLAGSRLKQKL